MPTKTEPKKPGTKSRAIDPDKYPQLLENLIADSGMFFRIGLFHGYVAAKTLADGNSVQGQFDKEADKYVQEFADAEWADYNNPSVTFDASPKWIRDFMETSRKESR